jgi:pimeloyl-ACP methyl ester carboxylesterase
MSVSTVPRPIVLIHGLWMNPLSWEHWVARFTAAGHEVHAPAWPGLEGEPATLRQDTSGYDNLGIEEILAHYTAIIAELHPAPIIMGHSFGGAFTQVLLDRGLGGAGVAIDPAPVKGMLALPVSTLRSSFPVLKNPANRHRAVPLTAAEFHYAFGNTLSEEASREVYERYAVPGPGGVLFEGALANLARHPALEVDFKNGDRAPLLLIAGGEDHISPASLTESNFRHYKHSDALTEYREFPGRSHFTVGQEGWEEVADFALTWAVQHARPA